MLILIILFLIMLTILIIKFKCNKISKNLMLLFVIWTLTILGISALNLYGLYHVSSTVYILWIINILFFVITVLITSKKENNQEINKTNELEIITDKIKQSKLLNYISIIVMVLLLYYEIRYLRLTANMPTEYLRMARFKNLFHSGVESIFFDYILAGTLRIILMITSILILKRKYKNTLCLFGIISLILYSLIGYGRMIIFEFIIYILVSYIIISKKSKRKINFKKIIFIIVMTFFMIFFAAALVVIRLKGIEKLNVYNIYNYGISEQIKQIVIYFTGGFRSLNNFIDNSFYNLEKLTLGRATFAGIEDYLGLILNNIGYNFNTINSRIGVITQTNILIGDKITFNAFYTCVMNYYSDLGYLGIIIYPIIHGGIVSFSINNYIKKKDIISILLVLYTMMNALSSIYRWNYQLGQYLLILIVLLVLNKIKKASKKY